MTPPSKPLDSDLYQTPEESSALLKTLGLLKIVLTSEEQLSPLSEKSAKLFEACELGHDDAVIAWLLAGADPNHYFQEAAFERFNQRKALDIAITCCGPKALEALFDAQAQLSKHPQQNTPQFLEYLLLIASKKASMASLNFLCERFKDHPHMSSASVKIYSQLFDHKNTHSLFKWALCSKKTFTDIECHKLAYEFITSIRDEGSFVTGLNKTDRDPMNQQIIDSVYPQFPSAVKNRIFGEVVFNDHLELLKQLLMGGHKPHRQWMAKAQKSPSKLFDKVPLLALAFLGQIIHKKVSESYHLLKKYAPTMHQTLQVTPPDALLNLNFKEIKAFHAEGFRMDGLDSNGKNLAQLWGNSGQAEELLAMIEKSALNHVTTPETSSGPDHKALSPKKSKKTVVRI